MEVVVWYCQFAKIMGYKQITVESQNRDASISTSILLLNVLVETTSVFHPQKVKTILQYSNIARRGGQ